MARKPGSLALFTCRACKERVPARGGNQNFQCTQCAPVTTKKRLAHKAVADAIAVGDLRRPAEFACVDCGVPATEYDHRDYDEPLKVDPVCRRCNLRRGPAANHGVVLRQAA